MSYETHADLGGTSCTAAIVDEPEDFRFHAEWEAHALAVTLAMGGTGTWNIDMSRAARETLPDYARLTYYQIWITALENMLVERGLVSRDELAAGRIVDTPVPLPRRLAAADVPGALAKGSPTERPATRPARFAVGDMVRTRAGSVPHHTRLPGYTAGRTGRIERVLGMHVFADAHAQGLGENPQWLYTIVFEARALWGEAAARGQFVSVDAWEPYLEPA